MLSRYVAVGSIIIVALLSAALYFTGKYALDQHDQNLQTQYALKLKTATDKLKGEQQAALKIINEASNAKITSLESENKRINNVYQKAMLTADQSANKNQMQFGDDVLRDFIRIDCLWSKGSDATRSSVRSACSREAQNADPTSSGVYFSVLDPELIRRWGEACRELDTFGGGKSWQENNPGITADMCHETLLAMTPATSVFLRNWINNGENLSTKLYQHIDEQDQIIDELTKKRSGPLPASFH